MPNYEKRHHKILVTKLVSVKVLGAQIIIRAFKAISMQTLNIKAYLFFIRLELDKKANKITILLYLGFFYLIITQNK